MIKEYINNNLNNNMENLKSTMIKNKIFNVDINKSSIYHFELESLILDLLIFKYQNDFNNINEIEILKDILDNFNNLEYLTDMNIKDIIDNKLYNQILENFIKEFIENKKYIIKEIENIRKNKSYIENELYFYIIFNFKSNSLNINDYENINRHGESMELLTYRI